MLLAELKVGTCNSVLGCNTRRCWRLSFQVYFCIYFNILIFICNNIQIVILFISKSFIFEKK